MQVAATSYRHQMTAELTRKAFHILGTLGFAALSFFISLRAVALLALLAIPVLLIVRKLGIFSIAYSVGRNSFGEFYYFIGIAIAALFAPNTFSYIFGVLVLGFSDSAAALVGRFFVGARRQILARNKTLKGSVAFFATTFALAIPFVSLGVPVIIALVAVAIFLTLIEALSTGGIDNLFLPPLATQSLGLVMASPYF